MATNIHREIRNRINAQVRAAKQEAEAHYLVVHLKHFPYSEPHQEIAL